ncbi:MAG: geranylgeranyl pyrophosphate synthase [Oleiphilaceae bacterium]
MFNDYKSFIDGALQQTIHQLSDPNSTLAKAIQYSTLLGGKRVRPTLVLLSAESFGANKERAKLPACAVELIHAYSLIHDDLPAMDDDNLRRGQATCHKAFNEATAILAGDALQTMAFELLTQESHLYSHNQFAANNRIRMIETLARASGARGMALGQSIDFESVGQNLGIEQLEMMHKHKTGALIEASVMMGALCSTTEITTTEETALKHYAQAIGLAFQVQDDILDIVSDTQTLGKTQGADIALNKPTYPALLGLEGARKKLQSLHQEALASLKKITKRDTSKLAEISYFIVKRTL